MGDVFPVICRVGRTSWGTQCEICHAPTGTHLATVSTTVVAVDPADILKPVPVPCAHTLRALISEEAAVGVPELPAIGPRPDAVFVWRTEVRSSDCDSHGHMNNALYCCLMEDARLAAVRSGALPAAFSGSARLASVEYLGQPNPGNTIDIAVWLDEVSALLCFEFAACGNVVSRGRWLACADAVVGPPPEPSAL
eukprot:NODE_18499_length_889_cov_5.393701.p1 GENE.NODE_18499_length_889_cov_5.393701~~NODE_18499_length_889_cov_5.393701.p1  ORF type:complete len:195 (+),score=40.83 NODE_18499_length_889_cov_5.393701:142-726(+)